MDHIVSMKFSIIALVTCLVPIVLLAACSGKRPDDLGTTNGQLAPCPNSPNCVSTQASDDAHAIRPIPMAGSIDEIMKRVTNTVKSMGGEIVTLKDLYLHAEFTSRVWRFVDDFECFYDHENDLLHVRSASRIGYSDFNVNRERVERFFKQIKK